MRGCSISAPALALGLGFGSAGLAAALVFAAPLPLRAEPARPVQPAQAPDTPLPPPRPRGLSGPGEPHGGPDSDGRNPPSGAQPPAASAPAAPAVMPADESACRERLTRLGVKYEPLPPIVDGACGSPWPLRVTALSDGLALAPSIVTDCTVAEALARWSLESAAPAANRELGGHPTRMTIGTSYECRSQNRQTGAKLSEHAFADAVDVMGFDFQNRKTFQVSPLAAETPEGRFLTTIRADACRYFTTVLGPGSDPSHENHLHLDLRKRSRDMRLCQ